MQTMRGGEKIQANRAERGQPKDRDPFSRSTCTYMYNIRCLYGTSVFCSSFAVLNGNQICLDSTHYISFTHCQRVKLQSMNWFTKRILTQSLLIWSQKSRIWFNMTRTVDGRNPVQLDRTWFVVYPCIPYQNYQSTAGRTLDESLWSCHAAGEDLPPAHTGPSVPTTPDILGWHFTSSPLKTHQFQTHPVWLSLDSIHYL